MRVRIPGSKHRQRRPPRRGLDEGVHLAVGVVGVNRAELVDLLPHRHELVEVAVQAAVLGGGGHIPFLLSSFVCCSPKNSFFVCQEGTVSQF